MPPRSQAQSQVAQPWGLESGFLDSSLPAGPRQRDFPSLSLILLICKMGVLLVPGTQDFQC